MLIVENLAKNAISRLKRDLLVAADLQVGSGRSGELKLCNCASICLFFSSPPSNFSPDEQPTAAHLAAHQLIV